MNMLSPDILRKVHNAVCAVGVLPLPLEEWRKRPLDHPLDVQGSGFLVRPNTVITNRHVLDSALEAARERGLPQSQLFISFIAPSRLPKPIETVRMIRRTHLPQPGHLDVALLEIKPEPDAHFQHIVPLLGAESPQVTVSEEVAVCGYPYGNMLLQPDGAPYRFGPVLQQGFVSGLSPFAGSSELEEILLDVRSDRGMSGSPVVRPQTGEVLGILYETMMDRTAVRTTCFAIPLDADLIHRWLAEFDEVLRDA
jgi:S1-C subfamily serine protease